MYERRRSNAGTSALHALVGAVTFAFGVGVALAEPPPNVVLILSDDQAWDDYGFMGSKVVKTPHLDELASRSLIYERGYVVSPLCRPSLASIVTGLHPHEHGVVGNDVSPARREARDAEDRPVRAAFHEKESLVRFLVERGYLAFQSGKWWEGSARDGGFTRGMTHGEPTRGGRHGDIGLGIGREGLAPVAEFLDLAREAEKPFFLWYAPFLPHTPHNPPERLLASYLNKTLGLSEGAAKYYAMIEWFDETCGDLLRHLDERGLRENTLVVYVCDNGWRAADAASAPLPREWWNDYAPKSKGSPYEAGVRTPILFSLPGKLEPRREMGFASSIDIFPTIASLCGFGIPERLSGFDLTATQRDQLVGSAYSIHNMTPGEPFDTLQYGWLREGDWKFLLRHDGTDDTRYRTVHEWDRVPVQLFDLSADPEETKNVASEHPALVERFSRILSDTFSPFAISP